jgi:fumarate reductase flavoprotein subunit
MAQVISAAGMVFDASCGVLIIGAGAAGLIAALRAKSAGAEVLVLERDGVPRGSTALSAGLIPAAGTRFQAAASVADSAELFQSDIMGKAHGEPDVAAVATVIHAVGPALEWLADTCAMPFSVITNFNYPGHSAYRMHGLPSRSGGELMDRLRTAAEHASIDIMTNATATALCADVDGTIRGVHIERPDGTIERIGCDALILACNGYGGNPALISNFIPDMADALYFGHPGNQGDAVQWGHQLGAATRHLSGYQGHGSVAHPHGILITWATVTEGGFQINLGGERFANEARGYSESAASVLAQPDQCAWTIFDARIADIARQFEDFRAAEAGGAIVRAASIDALALRMQVPAASLRQTFETVGQAIVAGAIDTFGRNWSGVKSLAPEYCAVRVTGALFHTQGGLVVDQHGRVLRTDGVALPNLFAAGGAACGVSGAHASGYLSGNGLLTAVAYGFLAGQASAAQCHGNRDRRSVVQR